MLQILEPLSLYPYPVPLPSDRGGSNTFAFQRGGAADLEVDEICAKATQQHQELTEAPTNPHVDENLAFATRLTLIS